MYQKISIFSLYKKIIKNYWNHNRFVIFRKPNENQVFFYSHSDSDSKEEKFFIIQDFDHNYTIKIVPKKIYCSDIQKSFVRKSYEKNSFLLTDSLEYKNLIKKAIEKIRKGYFKKVVLSRSIKISFHSFYWKKTFQKLIVSYPNALVSLWYDIRHGFWIGCTPELLMQIHKRKFKTVALAGTIWNKYKWTKKEKEEHQIVIKYIIHLLKKNYNGSIVLEETKTVKMGHLKHLETPIFFYFSEEPDYYEILNKLHPTPSICGAPKKESLDFIQKHEGYTRNFYTGYIGIVNRKSMEFYIHLRCARIKEDKKEITLYAGSGITIDSDIDREYLETKNKVQNIFSQLFFK
ncbi:isochorismate synthase [Blattabacterium sp. (Blattella germanica) str. Bge]|uniref:chorismate-binding protein n=1 Tax=Blattabacterium sp. (Blattella germanica) TaxID=624186 RepID=UPI0001BB610C|nr:chorismate-binding protein [Blattabacterium sp. (Blattella germanica)]ACY40214.1 isochorismate synthase [Blattabacterium sp. (Blattella germanica) str. Bge]